MSVFGAWRLQKNSLVRYLVVHECHLVDFERAMHMRSTIEPEWPMRIASCVEDGFSFISHSDSNERRIE